jgi:hypothetical protein
MIFRRLQKFCVVDMLCPRHPSRAFWFANEPSRELSLLKHETQGCDAVTQEAKRCPAEICQEQGLEGRLERKRPDLRQEEAAGSTELLVLHSRIFIAETSGSDQGRNFPSLRNISILLIQGF